MQSEAFHLVLVMVIRWSFSLTESIEKSESKEKEIDPQGELNLLDKRTVLDCSTLRHAVYLLASCLQSWKWYTCVHKALRVANSYGSQLIGTATQ